MLIFVTFQFTRTGIYKQFCANVLERSNIQYQVQQKELQNRTPLETQCIKQDFVVTSTNDGSTISALSFIDLIHHSWISEEVINFMGKVFIKDTKRIQIFATQSTCLVFASNNQSYDSFSVKTLQEAISSSDADFLYIPIHQNRYYWCLTRLDLKKKIRVMELFFLIT